MNTDTGTVVPANNLAEAMYELRRIDGEVDESKVVMLSGTEDAVARVSASVRERARSDANRKARRKRQRQARRRNR